MTVKANMALGISDEQEIIIHSARKFCREKSPILSVRERLETEDGFPPELWKEMVDLGWLGAAIPEDLGGIGLSIGSVLPIAESMGRYLLATPFFSSTLASQAILRAGTVDQQRAWLPEIAGGAIGTVAFLDNEDWGSDTILCSAENQGESLALNGVKWSVNDALAARFFVISVNYEGEPGLVIVRREQLAESAIIRQTLVDETKRAYKVDLSGVVVPKSEMLIPEKCRTALNDLRLIGALLTAAEACGSAMAALDLIVDYLKIRKQFGRTIGSYQALKHPTVEILNQIVHARALLYHAGTIMCDEPLDKDTEIACRMAKAQASEALLFAGDRAVQFHGGMGFTYECHAQLYIRRALWAQQQFGDAYHHRKRLASIYFD